MRVLLEGGEGEGGLLGGNGMMVVSGPEGLYDLHPPSPPSNLFKSNRHDRFWSNINGSSFPSQTTPMDHSSFTPSSWRLRVLRENPAIIYN